MKHYDQKQFGEERVYSPSLREVKAGIWRQRLIQRPGRGAAYWPTPRGLLSLFSYRTQDHQPGVTPPTVGGAPPTADSNTQQPNPTTNNENNSR